MTILTPQERAKRIISLLKGYKNPVADAYISYYERNGELTPEMLEAADRLERKLDKQRLTGDTSS